MCSTVGYPWPKAPQEGFLAPAWVSHRPLRGVPAAVWAPPLAPVPQGCPCSGTGHPQAQILWEGPWPGLQSPQQHASFNTKCLLSKECVSSNVPFHVLLPKPSYISPPVSLWCPLTCLLPSCILLWALPKSPPMSPVPSSYCPFLNMSKQQHHVVLWQVEVLARGGLFSSTSELTDRTGQLMTSSHTGCSAVPCHSWPNTKHKYPDCGGNSQKTMRYDKLNDNLFLPKITCKTKHIPFPQLRLYSPAQNS